MLPTSRCLGGIARSKDLRAVSRLSGNHPEAPQPDQPLPDTCGRDTLDVRDRIAGPSRHPNDALSVTSSVAPQQARHFHTSSRIPYDSTSYNVADVPDFFIKYKQHRATQFIDTEGSGLMRTLADAILSGDVVASTRRLKAKIPVEHQVAEGHVVHPSGFVVPGPGHASTSDVARAKERERNENRDRLVQTAAVAHCVFESDFEQVAATTVPSSHKVPFEVRESDGIVKHPSGFVPPTPAHKFRYTVNSNVLWERKTSPVRQRARQSSLARAVLRAMHTAPAPETLEDA